MSDSENYFSESDNEQVNEDITNTPNSEGYESSDYEMDEDTRRIVFDHVRLTKMTESTFFQDGEGPKKKSKKRKKKNNSNKGKNLLDFMSDLESKEQEGKPRKWRSKRFNEKKEKLGISKEKVVRRRFNPRLPIPTQLTFKKKDIVTVKVEFDEESFPTLETLDISTNNVVV